MIVVMDQIEKQSHKKYEQLALLTPQSAGTGRLLNEFEDLARQSLNSVCVSECWDLLGLHIVSRCLNIVLMFGY